MFKYFVKFLVFYRIWYVKDKIKIVFYFDIYLNYMWVMFGDYF